MNHRRVIFYAILCSFLSNFNLATGPMDNKLVQSFVERIEIYLQWQEIKTERQPINIKEIINDLMKNLSRKKDQTFQFLKMALFRHDKLAIFLSHTKLKILTEIERGNFEFIYQIRSLFPEEELIIVYSFANIFKKSEFLAAGISFITKELLYHLYEMIEVAEITDDQALTEESLSPQSARSVATSSSESQDFEDQESDEELFKAHKISLPPIKRTLHNALVLHKNRFRSKSMPTTQKDIAHAFS